jgi:hypothetical protein
MPSGPTRASCLSKPAHGVSVDTESASSQSICTYRYIMHVDEHTNTHATFIGACKLYMLWCVVTICCHTVQVCPHPLLHSTHPLSHSLPRILRSMCPTMARWWCLLAATLPAALSASADPPLFPAALISWYTSCSSVLSPLVLHSTAQQQHGSTQHGTARGTFNTGWLIALQKLALICTS